MTHHPVLATALSGVSAVVAASDVDAVITAVAWLVAAAALMVGMIGIVSKRIGTVTAKLGDLEVGMRETRAAAQQTLGEVAAGPQSPSLAAQVQALRDETRERAHQASAERAALAEFMRDSQADRGDLNRRVRKIERHIWLADDERGK